jgi:hypothetical protein
MWICPVSSARPDPAPPRFVQDQALRGVSLDPDKQLRPFSLFRLFATLLF